MSNFKEDILYDAGPTGCGELIMKLFLTIKKMKKGEIIKVISYDPGAKEDIPAWCRLQEHRLLEQKDYKRETHYFIQKIKCN
ncbi:sulfurtransferase TusA family protein [Bacillus sp. PK3_68]|uniref:sulfurtransferase TusA family protein n=1 Tax=Bacillus sp. PK3_68 TaxID=2027408 RepID=UPI000E756E36|nr:sulfurtransferase TusA family protein [Bacillus sp. PK3_68]RJS50070.1 aminotransferase [Bacillus sp. PK3_68]